MSMVYYLEDLRRNTVSFSLRIFSGLIKDGFSGLKTTRTIIRNYIIQRNYEKTFRNYKEFVDLEGTVEYPLW